MDNFTWNSNYNLIVDCRGLPEDYQRFLKLSRIFDSFRGRDYHSYILIMGYVFRLMQKLVSTSDVCPFTV